MRAHTHGKGVNSIVFSIRFSFLFLSDGALCCHELGVVFEVGYTPMLRCCKRLIVFKGL